MSKAIDKFREGMSEDGDVDAEVFNDLCDHAETLEEQLAVEKYRVSAMAAKAAEGFHTHVTEPEPSDWLAFPWGGVVRKSKVVSVEHVHGDLESRCCIQIVLETGREIEEYADGFTHPEEKAVEWLADIEGQLGVKR